MLCTVIPCAGHPENQGTGSSFHGTLISKAGSGYGDVANDPEEPVCHFCTDVRLPGLDECLFLPLCFIRSFLFEGFTSLSLGLHLCWVSLREWTRILLDKPGWLWL